jgi:hypothetical protein
MKVLACIYAHDRGDVTFKGELIKKSFCLLAVEGLEISMIY